MPAPHHSSFLPAGCPSCCRTNSVKALKALTIRRSIAHDPVSITWLWFLDVFSLSRHLPDRATIILVLCQPPATAEHVPLLRRRVLQLHLSTTPDSLVTLNNVIYLFNEVTRCWCGYLSRARCRLFAYGPADATAIPKTIACCLI